MTVTANDNNPGADSGPAKHWNWKDNIPLLVGGFSLLFIGIRLLTISNYDFETAYGILQASGTTTVVVGALIPIVGAVMPMIAVWIADAITRGRIEKASQPLAKTVAATAIITSFFVTPAFIELIMLGGLIVILPVSVIVWRFKAMNGSRRGRKRNKLSLEGPAFIAVTATIIFLMVLVNSIPWVPCERLVTRNGSPFAGYVIGQTDVDTTILVAASDKIIHISPDTIISRTVCRQPGVFYGGLVKPLMALISSDQEPAYPDCRK